MSMSITLIIIVITAIVSFAAFSNEELKQKLIFYPPAISQRREWYRFFTHGLIHANIAHLVFNLYAFYSFGTFVEGAFGQIFGDSGKLLYLVMYITAIAAASIPEYMAQRDNYYYQSLGASGAVSGVIFAAIFLDPLAKVGLFFIPPIIPGFIFGPLYLVLTAYLAKRGGGGINHSAHLWGALYGIAFLIVMSLALHTEFNPIDNFVQSVKAYLQG
jgi:membrane associated rhomboid family serine protease